MHAGSASHCFGLLGPIIAIFLLQQVNMPIYLQHLVINNLIMLLTATKMS